MSYLLVHGAWHGAWCWDKLIAELESRGESAVAIDLPGHGKGERAGWHISLDDYADAVNASAETLGGNVHLVGHSMGGVVISEAAERRPDLYQSLTYATAFLLPSGQSLLSAASSCDSPDLKKANKLPNLIRGYGRIDPRFAVAAFYNSCSEEDASIAVSRLCAQSLRPFLKKLNLTDKKWGSIRRNYVFCEQDNAIPLKNQRLFVEALPCDNTVSLDTDHSPFMSAPEELAESLLSLTA